MRKEGGKVWDEEDFIRCTSGSPFLFESFSLNFGILFCKVFYIDVYLRVY